MQRLPLQRHRLQRRLQPGQLLGAGSSQQALHSRRMAPRRACQLAQQGPQLGWRQGQGAVEGGLQGLGRVGARALPGRPAAGAGIEGEVRKGVGVWRVGVGFARRFRGSGGGWGCVGDGWGFDGRLGVLGGDRLPLQRHLQLLLLRRFDHHLQPGPLLGAGGGQQSLQGRRWGS